MSAVAVRTAFPVIEVFGPTVQGEGPDAGRPAFFIRLGGCDYRCNWCDTMYAVDPAAVRENSRRLSVEEIFAELTALEAGPTLVVLSGGNPALHELGPLVDALQCDSFEVAVETQGSIWRDWLGTVDQLVVSPKPPSSGMAGPKQSTQFQDFMARAEESGVEQVLKVVVFDEEDLLYAERVASAHPVPLYLSVGTEQGLPDNETKVQVLARLRWLCEAVAGRPALGRARVMPQLHVLAWGTARGV